MPACVHCGQHFESRRGSARYCSEKCGRAAYKTRKRGEGPKPVRLACCICGKEFDHTPVYGGKLPSCCSAECRAQKERERKKGSGNSTRDAHGRPTLGFGLSFDPYAQPDFYAFCAFGRSALPASHPTMCPVR